MEGGRMYTVDLYLRVRLACHVDGLSQREAASRFGIARETVRKMLRHSEPPGYRRRQPPKRPRLAPFTDIIDCILEEDRTVHRKQHRTAKRIFERLRDEHGFTGKETIVKDYVRERRLRRREMFVPLSYHRRRVGDEAYSPEARTRSGSPGYVRTRPPVRPKLAVHRYYRPYQEDKDRPKRHTSKRIFERCVITALRARS